MIIKNITNFLKTFLKTIVFCGLFFMLSLFMGGCKSYDGSEDGLQSSNKPWGKPANWEQISEIAPSFRY